MGVIRVTGLTARPGANGDKAVSDIPFDPGTTLEYNDAKRPDWRSQIGGLAIDNMLAVVSLPRLNKLLFIDTGHTSGGGSQAFAPLDSPRGMVFDKQGRLLVLSGKRLLRFRMPPGARIDVNAYHQLPESEVVVSEGLEDPQGITLDVEGNIYVADRGSSSQVHVFTAAGKLVRSIGHAGLPKAGAYDPLHMNNPRGLSIDSNQHLWVAEEDFQPKRVSVWSLDGKLLKAFYGPSEYGGGGSLDSRDRSLFYYHGMEFKLDWQTGANSLEAVLYRAAKDAPSLPRSSDPTSVIYSNGHRYFTNAFIGAPTTGASIALLFLDKGGVLHPAAAMGKANDWPLLRSEPFRSGWSAGISDADFNSNDPARSVLFTWSDLNGDGMVDPGEVSFLKSSTGSITVMSDLSLINAYVDGKVVRYAPRFAPDGTPGYNLGESTVVLDGAQIAASDGGGQVLFSSDATVLTTAPKPFARQSLGGMDSKGHRWSYPTLWPGLHPAHNAPTADRAGELIGTTRLLGDFVSSGEGGIPLWGINGNFGDIYLFTADGLFVSQLFQDVRTGKPWNMPTAERNMLLNSTTMHDENFYPSLYGTADGQVYVIDGSRTSLVRVDGLDTLKAIASHFSRSEQR